MKSLQQFIVENERLFRQDNPGGDWLKRKKEHAEEAAKKAQKHTATHNGYTGAVTGYFKKNLKLPVKHLKNIPGAMGEERHRDDFHNPKHKELTKSVEKHGFNSEKHPIMIGVNHKGKPHVLEGNHRLAHAIKHGHSHIHAEVKYWNGGEEVKGHGFHPDQVEHLHHHGEYKGIEHK